MALEELLNTQFARANELPANQSAGRSRNQYQNTKSPHHRSTPTLKTAVFGFIIGSIASYFGYTTDKGAQGVGEAATNSVVVSSLLIIVADVVLIKCIFFLFPETAI